MLQIAGNCALRQKHKDKKIRTHLAKTRTKESTAFRFGSSQVNPILHSIYFMFSPLLYLSFLLPLFPFSSFPFFSLLCFQLSSQGVQI